MLGLGIDAKGRCLDVLDPLLSGMIRRLPVADGSFHGGISGPSQEQVHEAMEIFGEGIQGFMKSGEAEDVEVGGALSG